MWIVLALASGIFYSASGLLARHVLKGDKDAWAYSFYFSAVGLAVSFPFAVYEILSGRVDGITTSLWAWGLIIVVDLFVVAHNLLNFKANNYIPASLSGVITKFRLIWIFIFGILILGEDFSWLKLGGTLLTVLAGVVLIGKFNKGGSLRGIAYAFSATAIFAFGVVSSKYLLEEFTPAQLTTLIFLIPTIVNFLIMPNSRERIASLYKIDGKFVIIGCAFGALANLAMNSALDLGEATKVPVIIEAFLVVVLAGEFIALKERDHLLIKLFAVVAATVGAIIIRLA